MLTLATRNDRQIVVREIYPVLHEFQCPENLHLINGLYDAKRSRLPVLAIASHIPSCEIGSQYFQETHPESIFRECGHYCELISQAEPMPRVLEIAIQTALAKRGVAIVVLPGDVALHDAINSKPRIHFAEIHTTIRPSDEEIARTAGILNDSRKLTIFGGTGCDGAHAELMELAGKLKAPIAHALRGKEFIEYDNPFDVGMTGLLGFSSGYRAMLECDTLLMLGTDFPHQQFYPEIATIIHVDILGEQIGRRTKVDLGVVGDVKTTLRALLPNLPEKTDDQHLSASIQDYQKARAALDDLAVGETGQKSIHPHMSQKQSTNSRRRTRS
jgi:pyruvate dehydrogenase (quinone)